MQYNLEAVIDFIISHQNADGHFPTYELYPVVKPGEDWSVLPDSSPFITSNILYSLLSLNKPELKPAIDKGCQFLQSCMEHGGYWRFWPHLAKQHPIPLDMDDTSVASYVLQQSGFPLNNKDVIAANCDKNGYYYTWFIPLTSNLISHPGSALYFLRACIHGLPTRIIKFYTYTDKEPGVAANALLYLGESEKTEKGIQSLIEDIKNEKFRLQFYHDEIMVYYHVARAYGAGVKSLGALREVIGARLSRRAKSEIEKWDELLKLMAAIVFLDCDIEYELAKSLIAAVAAGPMYPDNWKTLAYFSSENRNFMAGSPEFVAALFAEAVEKLNRKVLSQ